MIYLPQHSSMKPKAATVSNAYVTDLKKAQGAKEIEGCAPNNCLRTETAGEKALATEPEQSLFI